MIGYLKDKVLESALGYRLWSAPLIEPKVNAIQAILHEQGKTGGNFLDIGCGPGSNSRYFSQAFEYLGVDINPAYIIQARVKFPKMKFAVADATQLALDGQKFDVVLMNSLIHHINDEGSKQLLSSLLPLLREDSVVIAQEPLIPEPQQKFMRLLMNADRGKHFRHMEDWQRLFRDSGYNIATEAFYSIKLLTLPGWLMYSTALKKLPL